MGDSAGELANRLHLLALRHLCFECLLLGRLHGVDDCGFFRFLAFRTIGHGIHVEPDVPLLIIGKYGVDRRDVGLR